MRPYLQIQSLWVLGLQHIQHILRGHKHSVLSNSQQKLCAYVFQKTRTRIFIAALLIYVILNQEITQMPSSSRADTQIVAYSHNGILHSNKKECSTVTHNMHGSHKHEEEWTNADTKECTVRFHLHKV